MQNLNSSRESARFGVFELDLRAGELRKQGLKIKLQEKPFQVLVLLLERPGELVTREELQKKLWPEDTFVDFDHSMNTAVNKLREALGDSAESPRFIETLPKRGYRFIAPVQPAGQTAPAGASTIRRHPAVVGVAAALMVVLGLGAYLAWERWGRRATPPEGRVMLVVLPFHNVGGDAEQEYFTDGLTEEMISQLGRLHPERLRVIASTSAMHYKKSSKRVDEIGRELGVDYVLEGSVRRGGERVRITAQLVQVSDQTEVWSESYESSESDVLALQSEVARAIAQQIQLKLTPQEQARLATSQTINPKAHEAYLLGQHFWGKRSDEGLRKSIEFFEQAIAMDPSYAPAYSGLANSYFSSSFWGLLPATESMPKGAAAAQKAVELDETLAEAHASMAFAKMWESDWEGAEKEYKRMIELNPGYAQGRMWHGDFLTSMGRSDEAVQEMRRALELDPLSLMVNNATGWHLYLARRYDEAIAQFKRALELDPNFALAHYDLGRAYEQKGLYEQALAEFQEAKALSPETPYILAGLGHCYGVMGRRSEARRVLGELEALSQRRHVKSLDIAFVHLGLGNKEQTLAELEKSAAEREGWVGYFYADPIYDPLRSDPRFQSLLARVGPRGLAMEKSQ